MISTLDAKKVDEFLSHLADIYGEFSDSSRGDVPGDQVSRMIGARNATVAIREQIKTFTTQTETEESTH